MQSAISKATLGRLPTYLRYLENISSEHISAPAIARALGLGEVLVRKDLSRHRQSQERLAWARSWCARI